MTPSGEMKKDRKAANQDRRAVELNAWCGHSHHHEECWWAVMQSLARMEKE